MNMETLSNYLTEAGIVRKSTKLSHFYFNFESLHSGQVVQFNDDSDIPLYYIIISADDIERAGVIRQFKALILDGIRKYVSNVGNVFIALALSNSIMISRERYDENLISSVNDKWNVTAIYNTNIDITKSISFKEDYIRQEALAAKRKGEFIKR